MVSRALCLTTPMHPKRGPPRQHDCRVIEYELVCLMWRGSSQCHASRHTSQLCWMSRARSLRQAQCVSCDHSIMKSAMLIIPAYYRQSVDVLGSCQPPYCSCSFLPALCSEALPSESGVCYQECMNFGGIAHSGCPLAVSGDCLGSAPSLCCSRAAQRDLLDFRQ
eukprot:jgi/Ulvmu1/11925/UM082_0003.1